MSSTATVENTKLRIALKLPDHVLQTLERQAELRKMTLESLIAERLCRCLHHTASQPLYFGDDERAELERITGGHQISTAAQALARVKTSVTVMVGDVKVTLSDRLLGRIRSRTFRGETVEKVIERETLRGLEIFAGLR